MSQPWNQLDEQKVAETSKPPFLLYLFNLIF